MTSQEQVRKLEIESRRIGAEVIRHLRNSSHLAGQRDTIRMEREINRAYNLINSFIQKFARCPELRQYEKGIYALWEAIDSRQNLMDDIRSKEEEK